MPGRRRPGDPMPELPALSRLVDQPLREAWAHEEHVFSRWLAENLEGLSDAIGIPLEFEDREVRVEEFKADLLLRNPEDDTRVLVENQLERADHSHLGQILTYLAGLDVRIVVWIAEDFREAHLSAVNWLNEHTSDDFSFFAVKLRVVRIADSPLAPIFDIMAKPNEWERQLQAYAPRTGEMTEIGAFRQSFWKSYLERHPEDRALGIEPVGTNVWIEVEAPNAVVISMWAGRKGIGLFIRGPRGASEQVLERLEPVEDVLAERLGAERGRGKYGHFWGKDRRIDLTNSENWVEAIDWLHEEAHRYVRVLNELLVEGPSR